MPDIKLDGRVSIIRDKATNGCTIRYYAQDDFVIDTIVTTWSQTLSDAINQYDWQEGDDRDFMHFYKGDSVTIEGELNKLFDDVEIVEYSVITSVGFKTFRVPYSLENESKLNNLIENFHPTLVFFGTVLFIGDNDNQLEAVAKIKDRIK